MSDWNIKSGSRVLVHAGSSGVGTWVVQTAKVSLVAHMLVFSSAIYMSIELCVHMPCRILFLAQSFSESAYRCLQLRGAFVVATAGPKNQDFLKV